MDALPPQVFRLCKFGRMESGTVRNAVSAHTVLEGSLRAFQDEIFTGLQARIRAIAAMLRRRWAARSRSR